MPLKHDQSVDRRKLRHDVEAYLDRFAGRDREVLRLKYGIDCEVHTFRQIAKMFEVTPARIQQIESQLLRRLSLMKRLNRGPLSDVQLEAVRAGALRGYFVAGNGCSVLRMTAQLLMRRGLAYDDGKLSTTDCRIYRLTEAGLALAREHSFHISSEYK